MGVCEVGMYLDVRVCEVLCIRSSVCDICCLPNKDLNSIQYGPNLAQEQTSLMSVCITITRSANQV